MNQTEANDNKDRAKPCKEKEMRIELKRMISNKVECKLNGEVIKTGSEDSIMQKVIHWIRVCVTRPGDKLIITLE